ncbi:hypothetical protein D3C77_351630 [compost metagenome]
MDDRSRIRLPRPEKNQGKDEFAPAGLLLSDRGATGPLHVALRKNGTNGVYSLGGASGLCTGAVGLCYSR